MNDKEGRKWLLQKLYDKGFKYIFRSSCFGAYLATKQQPITKDNHKTAKEYTLQCFVQLAGGDNEN